MGVQIKDLNEETAPDSGDRFLVQRVSDNKYVSTTNANILPASSVNKELLTNADSTLTVTDTTTDRVWWRELARTTRTTSTDTITATILNPTVYMKVFISLLATGGTVSFNVRFNLDGSASYAGRASDNGGADTTATSATSFSFSTGTLATPQFAVMDMWYQSGVQTLVTTRTIGQSTAGKTTAPVRKEYTGKYVNSLGKVGTIEVINGAGTGDYAAGSEIVVLGHD